MTPSLPTHKGRWKLTIEYDGTNFAGWQRQDNALSVQECIETAMQKFCGETVALTVAGRTDAGVHAVGQVAHVDIPKPVDAKAVRDATNFHLRPHKVAIISAEPAAPEFNARMSAFRRVYCYRIVMNRRAETILDDNRAWHINLPLDISAMNVAAKFLHGTHDFTSFRAAECQAKSPLRSIDRLEVVESKYNLTFGTHIEVWAEARSFLHHQIRNITGTLKLVGEGKWKPEDVRAALEAKDRAKAGPTAPACGLYFVRVDYDDNLFTKAIDTMI